MNSWNRSILLPFILVFGLLAAIPAAQAGSGERFGFRVGTYTEPEDTFVGAEALVPISPSFYFNPNVEYVFSRGRTFATLNGDFHVDIVDSNRVFVWVGGGIAGIYTNLDGPSEGDLKPGANAFFGIGFRAGNVIPYIQPKVIFTEGERPGVLTFGLRF